MNQYEDAIFFLILFLFRDYIKKQKSIKDEIERQSIKSFKKVSDETSKLRKVSYSTAHYLLY
jgi:hypothetical protein